MKCNYTYSIMGYTAIFDRTTEEHTLDFEVVIAFPHQAGRSEIPFLVPSGGHGGHFTNFSFC